MNLINNAKDAILPLEERWIKVEVLDRGGWVDVAVTDSGKGVSKELLEKIMLPFFTTKPMGKGSGLGLSVSRAILENHGGSLRIDANSPNTRFIVSLPKNNGLAKSPLLRDNLSRRSPPFTHPNSIQLEPTVPFIQNSNP